MRRQTPPRAPSPRTWILAVMASIPACSAAIPRSLSSVIVVMTYIGVSSSLIRIGHSAVPASQPARSASRIASIPSYAKQVTAMSARHCCVNPSDSRGRVRSAALSSPRGSTNERPSDHQTADMWRCALCAPAIDKTETCDCLWNAHRPAGLWGCALCAPPRLSSAPPCLCAARRSNERG